MNLVIIYKVDETILSCIWFHFMNYNSADNKVYLYLHFF